MITVAMLIIILATIAVQCPRWVVWALIVLIGLETTKFLAAEARRERKFLEESK